jgi:hypothetical protein
LKADPRQAFVTDIATQHGRNLRRYLAARLRNAADVPHLVQEVFLRLLRIGRHETIRNPEAYGTGLQPKTSDADLRWGAADEDNEGVNFSFPVTRRIPISGAFAD